MPRIFAVQLKDGPAERYEAWVNTPVYTRDYEDCVGWLGCELPEDGHSCEFAVLAGDGAVACANSSEVNRLRKENAKLRSLACKWYPHMLKRVGRDALEQWGQMKVVRELGIEATDA